MDTETQELEKENDLELGATPYDDELTDEELALVEKTADELDYELEQEPEPEQEPEQEETKAEEDKKSDDVMIPKARLDQEIRNRRNIENELKEYREKEANKISESINQEEKKEKDSYLDSLENSFIEGDMRKVAEILASREDTIREEAIKSVQEKIPSQIQQTKQHEEFTNVKNSIEQAFPFLDPANETYEPELIDTIVAFSEVEFKKGKDAATALKDATSKVLLYEKPQEVERFLQAQGYAESKNEQQQQRQENRISQKVHAHNSQPPEMTSTISQAVEVPDFATMSDEEFDKLSPKELEEYMEKMEKGY